jgi:hypothetical protein
MGEIYGRNRSLRKYFSQSRFPQLCRISKGSQTARVCFSLKSKSYTELSVEHWRNDVYRRRPKYSVKNPVPAPLCLP